MTDEFELEPQDPAMTLWASVPLAGVFDPAVVAEAITEATAQWLDAHPEVISRAVSRAVVREWLTRAEVLAAVTTSIQQSVQPP